MTDDHDNLTSAGPRIDSHTAGSWLLWIVGAVLVAVVAIGGIDYATRTTTKDPAATVPTVPAAVPEIQCVMTADSSLDCGPLNTVVALDENLPGASQAGTSPAVVAVPNTIVITGSGDNDAYVTCIGDELSKDFTNEEFITYASGVHGVRWEEWLAASTQAMKICGGNS